MNFNGVDFDTYFKNYPDKNGYFGKYGGSYVSPELQKAMDEVTEAYFTICKSRKFIDELRRIRKEFQGRPTPISHLERLSNKLGKGFIPVRKAGKWPPSTVETKFEYEKEYGKDILELPKLVNEEYRGKSFYIVDDIYATGNTARAIKDAVQALGGNIIGTGVVINIKELNNDNLFSLIDINEE